MRVGRGGNIGRLRLRLEGGKDLRVDAEDVDLVVEVATECCTKKEQETEDEETGGLGRSMELYPFLRERRLVVLRTSENRPNFGASSFVVEPRLERGRPDAKKRILFGRLLARILRSA